MICMFRKWRNRKQNARRCALYREHAREYTKGGRADDIDAQWALRDIEMRERFPPEYKFFPHDAGR